MFLYRKKILLSLIDIFGGNLCGTDLQKLLFLFEDKRLKKDYEFIPYKFGCFSFQVMYDRNSLIRDGFLEPDEKRWITTENSKNLILQLKTTDRYLLHTFKNKYSNLTGNELIRYVYTNYPYFAINSEIASSILNSEELKTVSQFIPKQSSECLFTIGYEGLSLEGYLNKLIINNIKVLCDVRKNSFSYKYGFSKIQLQNACEKIGIKFIHIPDLGIVSEKRNSLITQSDYEKLFLEYEQTTLLEQVNQLNRIYELLKNYYRVALTCFESSPQQCHRGRIAKALETAPWNVTLKHL